VVKAAVWRADIPKRASPHTLRHTHHYEVHTDFYESWIANHPRRTGEAYWSQFLGARFIENNPVPRTGNFGELWAWFEPLVATEARAPEDNRRDMGSKRTLHE
jgi:hypothetical protein